MFSSYWSVIAGQYLCTEVYEEFLGFINIAKMDAQTIAYAFRNGGLICLF
jgi:hypothetical protein